MFSPTYRITGKVAKALMSLEADRQLVATLPLTARMLDSLRRTARLLSIHLSTQIEGNRLTAEQVEAVFEGEGNFPGRERDEAEVRHYFAATEYVERISSNSSKLIEKEVRTIHSLVMSGKSQASRYRDGQNVIRDSRTNRIVYMPPEPKDVPALMRELVRWINSSTVEGDIPVPVIAALAHYQFATIHPYFDGNGRTARLLTNLILHRNGYGLNGIYSLEEYYADNLGDYYSSLAVGNSHNYYFGRAEADVTPFVTYFCLGMAEAFATVRSRAELASRHSASEQSAVLRDLGAQQRRALGLFLRMTEVTRNDVAKFFKLPARQAYLLCRRWLKSEFLVIGNPSTKSRTYRLAKDYETLLVAKFPANDDSAKSSVTNG
jgi:Fic family protein